MTARSMLLLAAFLGMTLGVTSAKGQPATSTAPPDTGISCPIGFVRVVQLHAFRLLPAASAVMFKDSTTRTLPSGWRAFRGQDLRKRIARLASAPPAEVKGGWACQVYFGESKLERSFVDTTGDGMAVRILDSGAGLSGTACVVVDGSASMDAGTLSVEEGRTILVRVELDGQPHALALRVATVATKDRAKQGRAFREGVMQVMVLPTHDLTSSKPKASVEDYLKRRTQGAGPTGTR